MSVTMILMASMCLLLEALCPSVCSVCLLFYFMKTKLDKKEDLTLSGLHFLANQIES